MASSPLDDLPMPHPTNPRRPFKSYKVISFDVYGTLIDFKPGIFQGLKPLLNRLPSSSPWRQDSEDMQSSTGAKLLKMFKEQEDAFLVGQPVRPFSGVLKDIYLKIAEEIDVPHDSRQNLEKEAEAFGGSVGDLAAFDDSVEACRRLDHLGFRLVYLSNIERGASETTARGPLGPIKFWREYSANDFEQDDPDISKLKFLMERVPRDAETEKVGREDILHVANSLGHDHAPAKKLGLSTVWIVRDSVRWGKEQEIRDSLGTVGYGWRFNTLTEFVDAVEADVASGSGTSTGAGTGTGTGTGTSTQP